ncbi:hypothetical protein CRM79_22085 [Pantoea agglomerans]|nr:hypothetical protein [Pantoea agglomerans]PEI02144.1 hypothetical protein CRM79_22085 [Pantoea agglomerans]
MLDPNKLIEMLTNINAMSQSTQQSLSQSFMSGAAGMNLNGGPELEKMMSAMKEINEMTSAGMGEMMKESHKNEEAPPESASQQEGGESQQNSASFSFPKEAMDFFNKMQQK